MVLIRLPEADSAGATHSAEFVSQDPSRLIDFKQFGKLVKKRAAGIPMPAEPATDELATAYRFQELDPKRTGFVSIDDYTLDSLERLLTRSSAKALELFREWDVEEDGCIDLHDFKKTIRALGFNASSDEVDAIVHRLAGGVTADAPGVIAYRELISALCVDAGGLSPEASMRDLGGSLHSSQGLHDSRAASPVPGLSAELEASASESEDALRELVMSNLGKVMDLFLAWDEDGSGTIDRKEFFLALRSLGFDTPKDVADALFSRFDADGSGEIAYNELNKRLRKRVELDEKLRVGAAGEIMLTAKNKPSAAPKRTRKQLPNVVLDESKSVKEQMIAAIDASKLRIITLFQEWDTSGDGRISKREMLRALRELGIAEGEQGREVVDEFFEKLDRDGSGTIDFRELLSGLSVGTNRAEGRGASRPADEVGKANRAQTPGGWVPRQRTVAGPKVNISGATWDPVAGRFDGVQKVLPPSPKLKDRPVFKPMTVLRRVYAPRYERQPTLPPSRMRTLTPEPELSSLPSRSILRTSQSQTIEPLQRKKSRVLHGLQLGDQGDSLQDQLVGAITRSKERVVRIFDEWDGTGDGRISKEELREALQVLGLAEEPGAIAAADELFDALDRDGSGSLDMAEFFKGLRVKASRYSAKSHPALPLDGGSGVSRPGLTSSVSLPALPTAAPPPVDSPAVAPPEPVEEEPAALEATASSLGALSLTAKLEPLALPPPRILARMRPRAPIVQPGSHLSTSVLRRPRSLANLRMMESEDDEWFRAALDARILPTHVPRGGRVARC